MSARALAVPATDEDVRWRQWRAEGAEHDRKRTKRFRALALVVAIGLVVAALIGLV